MKKGYPVYTRHSKAAAILLFLILIAGALLPLAGCGDETPAAPAPKERSGRLLSVVQDTRFGPREIKLRHVNEIRPVYLIRDEDGTERMASSEEKEDTLKIDGPSSLKVRWERVPAGTYLAGFRIDSLSGESTRDCLKIRVK